MAPELGDLALRQVTLGGEIADDRLLATLAARLPAARLVHIYASTEVGVGFSVADRRAGFPAAWLETGRDGVGLKVTDDILWARPPGTRATAAHLEVDAEGYVRTGDRVSLADDRVLFLGRDSATVNIGGTKVQPEEVEAVIARHPLVAAAHIVARPNPILGAVLALSVVPTADADPATLVAALKAWVKTELPREAQPATIRIVESLAVNAAGKVAR